MSDRPIQEGDWVMVVKPQPCCGRPSGMDVVFKVEDISPYGQDFYCEYCGHDGIGPQAYNVGVEWFGISRLIRIDPPALPETIDTDREVTA